MAITYETAKRLAELEKSAEERNARITRCLDAEARGTLGWGSKGQEMGRAAYLSRVLPTLRAMADDGDEDALRAALDAEDGLASPKPVTDNLIGANIRAARESANISQGALAKAIGATQRQISLYESGDQDPTASRIIAIARALGVEPGELLR